MVEPNIIEALITRLAALPEGIVHLVENRDERELRVRPAQEEWSITETFAHLRAVDDIFTPRIYAILVRDSPSLMSYDERIWAEIAGYEQREFYTSLRLYTLRRAELINTLRHLTPNDWQRIGIHEEWGPMTLQAIVTFFVEHEEEHYAQMMAVYNA